MKSIDQRLGQRIARHRNAIGLTQAQLAEMVEVHTESISRIETGSRTASLDLIVHISQAIGLELHELFHLQKSDDPRSRAIEQLLRFVSRLSPAEIELVINVGSATVLHTQRTQSKERGRT